MQTKKIVSIIAAIAAASAMAVSVSAADWSQASFADNDPNTVKIVAQTADGVEFTNSATQTDICKARITLNKVLANPADYSKIATAEWTVTYKGVSSAYTNYQLAGGTYFVNSNSTGYNIEADTVDAATATGTWEKDTYSVTDTFTVSPDMPLTEDGEIVFMDWSSSNIGGAGITVTISDFKMFDADGNEIAQLGMNEWSESSAEPVEPIADEGKEDAPVDDGKEVETVPNAPTGNVGVSVAAAVCGLAGAGILATRKRKED